MGCIYSGTRFFAYELLKENVFKRNADGSFPLWKSALAAMSAGAIGQFAASPTDLVKVQMQTEGFRALKGEEKLYSGTMHCFRSMYQKMGFVGMWRGWFPNVQRAALVQLGDLTAYDIHPLLFISPSIIYQTTIRYKNNITTKYTALPQFCAVVLPLCTSPPPMTVYSQKTGWRWLTRPESRLTGKV